MKTIIVILCLLLSGCAMLQQQGVLTAEQRAALCTDTKNWISMAETALAQPGITIEGQQYWQAGLATARVALSLYCAQ